VFLTQAFPSHAYEGDEEMGRERERTEKGCSEEGPERHQEVAAADAAQIEGEVGPRGHEEHPEEAVRSEEGDHATCGRGEDLTRAKERRGGKAGEGGGRGGKGGEGGKAGPTLEAVHEVELRVRLELFGHLELLPGLNGGLASGASHPIGRDLSNCCACCLKEARDQSQEPDTYKERRVRCIEGEGQREDALRKEGSGWSGPGS
jgi:hypothetical protein